MILASLLIDLKLLINQLPVNQDVSFKRGTKEKFP